MSAEQPHSGDRFARLSALIGEEGMTRLENSFVLVIGLGAVGSYATEALARAGVGRLRLVDFDHVKYSNFNRQLLALESTLGMFKTEAARERIGQINPACRVEVLNCFVHTDTLDQVLQGPPDLVVDAIDALNPKVHLLAELTVRNIPVVSSMGAALRTDPAFIRVGPLSETRECPLARRLRKRLRSMDVDLDRITSVYSIEPMGEEALAAIGDQKDNDDAESRGRVRRPLGSLPTLTGIFGLTAAHRGISMLLGAGRPV